MKGARGVAGYILLGTRSSHPWALGQPFPTADGPGQGDLTPPSHVVPVFGEKSRTGNGYLNSEPSTARYRCTFQPGKFDATFNVGVFCDVVKRRIG